jgi:hypothetical protein
MTPSREGNKNYLTARTVIGSTFEILDTLPLYTELGEYGIEENKKHFSILMDIIVSMEVVLIPSQKIEEQIMLCHKAYKKLETDPNNTGDYIEPEWYHEIAAIKGALKEYQDHYESYKICR